MEPCVLNTEASLPSSSSEDSVEVIEVSSDDSVEVMEHESLEDAIKRIRAAATISVTWYSIQPFDIFLKYHTGDKWQLIKRFFALDSNALHQYTVLAYEWRREIKAAIDKFNFPKPELNAFGRFWENFKIRFAESIKGEDTQAYMVAQRAWDMMNDAERSVYQMQWEQRNKELDEQLQKAIEESKREAAQCGSRGLKKSVRASKSKQQ